MGFCIDSEPYIDPTVYAQILVNLISPSASVGIVVLDVLSSSKLQFYTMKVFEIQETIFYGHQMVFCILCVSLLP